MIQTRYSKVNHDHTDDLGWWQNQQCDRQSPATVQQAYFRLELAKEDVVMEAKCLVKSSEGVQHTRSQQKS